MTEAASHRMRTGGQGSNLEDGRPVSLGRYVLTVLGFACVGPPAGGLMLLVFVIGLKAVSALPQREPHGDVVGSAVILGYFFGLIPAVIAGITTCFAFNRVKRRVSRLLAAFVIGAASTLFFFLVASAGKWRMDADVWKFVALLICIGGFPAVLCAALFAPTEPNGTDQ
jgi:hypothetical protein